MIRVFIADDHAVVRDGLCYLLEAQPDLTVVGDAGNGREAVALVKQLKPDVVLMDISMPSSTASMRPHRSSRPCLRQG